MEPGPVTLFDRVFRVRYPWPNLLIRVCYRVLDDQQPNDGAKDLLVSRTRTLFESTWQRYANLQWDGWEECSDSSDPILLKLTSLQPSHSEPGFPGIGKVREVTLNYSASDAEILYVLGRALGFEHEYGRPSASETCTRCDDNPQACSGLPQRPLCLPSGFCGNPADHESIMQAPDCGGIELIRRLSPWDVAGVQRAYGRKPRQSLVTSSGYCIESPSEQPGTAAATWWCLDADNLRTEIRPGASPHEFDGIAVTVHGESRCFAAAEPPSTAVTTEVCDRSSERQAVSFWNTRLRGMGGICVVAEQPTPGAALVTQDCEAADPLTSRFEAKHGRIRLSETDLCIGYVDQAPRPGAPLVLLPCDGSSPQQVFEFSAGLFIAGELCAAIAGGVPDTERQVVLWDGCAAFPVEENQRFFLSGSVLLGSGTSSSARPEDGPKQMPAGRCLVPEGAGPGSGVKVDECNARGTQEWDYYF
jgi:hypothetical protein